MTSTRASLGVRAVARFVDIVLVMVPAFLVLSPLVLIVLPDARLTSVVAVAIAWIGVVGYETIFTAATGQTIGKRALGLRVVAVGSGRPPDPAAAFRRAACPAVLGVVIPVAGWFVAYLWAMGSASRRGLHDLFAGTEVIQIEIG
ncbi:MAG TPA: RDD family protein [Acidimicrobiia bacterium]|nr:RDD family protein [Acidimicrobiia bacterium]